MRSSLEAQRGPSPQLSPVPLAAGGCAGLPVLLMLGPRPCKNFMPISGPTPRASRPGQPDLGLAGSREVLMYEESAERHAKVTVGLAQADTGQLLWLVAALHLPCQLVQGLSERWGQVLTQDHHHAPHQVVV